MTHQEIHIHHAGNRYDTTSFIFPGGEVQLRVPDLPGQLIGDITVVARLQSAEFLVKLFLLDEVLRRVHRGGRRMLVIPYFPYARQDRVMQPNESFSLKAVARLINSLGFDEVVTCDPHSDVTPALVENIRVVSQVDLVSGHEPLVELIQTRKPVVVAPDAGASKKAFAVAQRFALPLVTASKVRDVHTGAITATEVPASPHIPSHSALIVDDICDGGRTFIELAKVLRAEGASHVFLYVTHGIFSQGLGVFTGLINGIFTTDAFLSECIRQHHTVPIHISHVQF